MPTWSSGRGFNNRPVAEATMAAAAMRIIVPSAPAEKYSALEWP
jgi:hypothetical protein